MDNRKTLGLRIKELRKRKGISQEKLAELVELEPPSICNIETGRNYPTFQNLEKIVEVLDSTFLEVFQFSQHQTPNDLIKEINTILKKNPDRIQDFYKIIKALVE